MAEQTGSFDSSKSAEQAAGQFAKLIQETMTNCFGWFQNSASFRGSVNPNSRLLTYANKRVGAASVYLNKLSQAADLQDIAKIQMEYMQMRMLMFNELTKDVGDAVSVASNLFGGFISLLNWQKALADLARSSPSYRRTGESERMRTWSVVPTQEGQSAEDDGGKSNQQPRQ